MIYDSVLGLSPCFAETQWLARRMNGCFFDDFMVELDDRFTEDLKDGGAALGEVIVAARALGLSDGGLGAEPPIALEALEQRIEGARADVITMLSQLAQHPLADDRVLRGMVEDVHLPKPQQNFAREILGIETSHIEPNSIITMAVNEYRKDHVV